MDKRGRKLESVLRISIVLIGILLGIFAEDSWAQAPFVQTYTPLPDSTNALINTPIKIQFNMTMDTTAGHSSINVEDEYGQNVAGAIPTIQWATTTNPNDTLIFIPQNGLKPATGYSYEGFAQSGTGSAWFSASFLTKYSMADATPPTVQTTYPYSGMTNFRTSDSIYIGFSEAMNPASITKLITDPPGNITLTGLCMGGATDYTVNYDIGSGDVEIGKATPFVAGQSCTVTVTTNVRDLRGNPLKNQYSWNFQTGAADTTPPTVIQTIPASSDTNVSVFPNLYAIFSEGMDESTFINQTNYITLRDNAAPSTPIPISIYWSDSDIVSFGPQSALTNGHTYTVDIGTGVKDKAGNSLTQKTWSFTTAGSGIDSDPIITGGLNRDNQIGQILSDGINPSITKVSLGLSAFDDNTNPLTVTAAIPGYGSRNLPGSPGVFGMDYSYKSAGNEGLSSGNYQVTFIIQDGAANSVTFYRDIYIFSACPTLTSPASGATGVSTTPTFTWTYGGSPRPLYYNVAVFDGPDKDISPMVWMGVMVDKGSGTHSITIPADKLLMPNKTYYWGVRGANRQENGETYTGLWPFTTGGTPPPAAHFIWTWVRSDDIYPPGPTPQGNLVAKVAGPSPADIVQLKVTGPGGFQYIFTEDDIVRSEQLGQYYTHNFPNPLSNGTYTFSVTDSAGRIVTATKDFTYASVPKVNYGTMSPVDNTYVNTTTPILSWGSVPGGYYYRVFIWDWNGCETPVYVSDFIQTTSITVPSGYLLPDTPYNWRVDVFDAPFGGNRSRSNNLRFSTGSGSYTTGTQLEWVQFYNENSYYLGPIKSISANVLGPLPNVVTSFHVSGPGSFSYDFLQTNIMYNLAWTHGSTYLYPLQPGAVAGGSYTFSLTTPVGTTNYGKNMTPLTIPIVDQATMSPANNAYLTNLTPTFSWNTVGGSYYYRIFIMDWRSRFAIYASTRDTSLSCTIPDGILKPGRSYMWRVEVYDGATGAANNRSTSAWNCFTTPRPSLVDHYYTSILGRTPDPVGKVYWEGEVERTQSPLGIDIKEGYMVMSGNFFTQFEYLGFGRSDEEFLTDLYLTFFNRDPDPGGFSYWLGELSSGSHRDMVMYYFMFSPEFYDFMSELFGDTTTRAEVYPVVDFYRGFLDRLPDDVGFAYWLNRFRTAQCVGAAAVTAEADVISSLFLSSDEYIGRGRTNAQYVQDLYYAFMRRYASTGEVGYWVGELYTGAKTREWLRLFFLASPEFHARVDAMIAQGCYSP